MNFLGIHREPDYSPGRHLSNDAKILRLVGQVLERKRYSVKLSSLDEARSLWKEADLIFSMCQGPQAVNELTEWKKEGALIFNDPEASRRTYRDSLCSAMRENDLGFPHSEFLSTEAHPRGLEQYRSWFENPGSAGGWLKRADVHAMQTGDVVRLERWADLNSGLVKFRTRGLKQAVLQMHCEGDEVKFYAVKGGRLFWPYYPKESEGYPFDEKKLKKMAEHAADALGLSIYGGDAIISPQGNIMLIDLNDWPSFAPCRGAAASAIAKYLKDSFDAIKNHRKTTRVPSPLVGEG
jgi:hypothetical protein